MKERLHGGGVYACASQGEDGGRESEQAYKYCLNTFNASVTE